MSAEARSARWKRRSRTIPTMLGLTAIGVIFSPVIVVVAVVVDVVRLRPRIPTARIALFLLQYAINDSVEIVLAPLYWLVAGLGTRLDGPSSRARHERLQAWSVDVMARRAKRLLGLRVDLDAGSREVLEPGPVIVVCRHVSILDTSLPTLLYQRLGYRTCGVIMAELLADPGFDLIYARTGSVFIPRDNGPEARQLLHNMSQRTDPTTAVVIFPEGRLFRRDRLERALARLRNDNPDRADRLAPLRHCLPPRPGGVLALLDAIPHADVVVIAHAGLDRFASFSELARAVPLREPVRVRCWRIPVTDIPVDSAGRIRWLDEQWIKVDSWVSTRVDTRDGLFPRGTAN